jgi:arylsulfatase A-like enzyme
MAQSPNVFILSADSLRVDYSEEIVSMLQTKLSGTNFTQAVATGSGTPHSIPSLTAGVYADHHDMVGIPAAGPPKTLAEVFTNAGYRCGLWSDNAFFGEAYNYDRGFHDGLFATENRVKQISSLLNGTPVYSFAKWVYFNIINRSGENPLYTSATTLHTRAVDWLTEFNETPTFCWIHYMDSHHPFEPPESYLPEDVPSTIAQLSRDCIKSNGEGYGSADLDVIESAYRGACEYLRDEISGFLDMLLESNYYNPNRDILVFTADHGEILHPESYSMMGHTPVSGWEELLRVPLFVAAPDWGAQTVEQQVSLIDFPGMVSELAGLKPSEQMATGGCDQPSKLARDAAFITHDPMWEMIYRGIRTPEKKLFAYRNPNKQNQIVYENIYTGEKQVQIGKTLGKKLDDDAVTLRNRIVSDHGSLVEDAEQTELSDDVEAHLSDLGYVDV